MTDKIDIPAMHDDDLKSILRQYNLLEKFEKGEIKCCFCDSSVNWDNIYGMTFKDNSLKLICDSIECLEKLNTQNNG